MTSPFFVEIQIITFVKTYDVGREGTIVIFLYLCTTIHYFHAYVLIKVLFILLWIAHRGMEGK